MRLRLRCDEVTHANINARRIHHCRKKMLQPMKAQKKRQPWYLKAQIFSVPVIHHSQNLGRLACQTASQFQNKSKIILVNRKRQSEDVSVFMQIPTPMESTIKSAAKNNEDCHAWQPLNFKTNTKSSWLIENANLKMLMYSCKFRRLWKAPLNPLQKIMKIAMLDSLSTSKQIQNHPGWPKTPTWRR